MENSTVDLGAVAPVKVKDPVSSADFRKELLRIMPGYKWTVHKPGVYGFYLSATGIQSAGFNRLSTLQVVVRLRKDAIEYEVKSSGFGKKAPWLSEATGCTLARALRALQVHYEYAAANNIRHARALEAGRKPAQQKEQGEEICSTK